ncbi:hypothetical protein HOA56_01225 [archaeon]|jgi:hypothetical protein|nr:hypothetical protein [archaeon]
MITTISISKEEKDAIKKIARKDQRSMSNLLIKAALEYGEKIGVKYD